MVGGREKILVVDDDPTARTMIRRVLQRHGWETQDASGPRDAVDAVLSTDTPFTVAVLDIALAGGRSGLVLADQLYGIDPDLRFLFISGHLDLDVTVARIPKNVMTFLGKPLSMTRLIEEVERLHQRLGPSTDTR